MPFRLVYSVRSPADAIYAAELARLAATDEGLDGHVRLHPTGAARVGGAARPARRRAAGPGGLAGGAATPDCFVCGPTGFVETAADLLVAAGHPPERIRTERFGPTGG